MEALNFVSATPMIVSPYLTDPASRPRTRYRCIAKNTTSGTAIDTKADVARISQSPPREAEQVHQPAGQHELFIVCSEEDEGDEKIVPRPEELEYREGGQRRKTEWQDDLDEDLEFFAEMRGKHRDLQRKREPVERLPS